METFWRRGWGKSSRRARLGCSYRFRPSTRATMSARMIVSAQTHVSERTTHFFGGMRMLPWRGVYHQGFIQSIHLRLPPDAHQPPALHPRIRKSRIAERITVTRSDPAHPSRLEKNTNTQRSPSPCEAANRGDRSRSSSIRFDASAFVSVSSNSSPVSLHSVSRYDR
jgi:hypothetical protein